MQPLKKWALYLLAVWMGACALSGAAQDRMSDKDVEATMKNLKDDSKKFRKTFDSALGKSTIRKTSQEKDAKVLSERLEKQTDSMLSQFKDKKKADTTLPPVLETAGQLQKTIESAGISDKVSADWSRVQTSLDKLAKEFNVSKGTS
jgi:hypothetical protein